MEIPDKTTYGPGPWQDEPDQLDFESHGFACRIIRPHHGALCGYVGVPVGHPWHGKGYDDIEVSIHGGLTYASGQYPSGEQATPATVPPLWWIGFDCAHGGDLCPGLKAQLRDLGHDPIDTGEVYRDTAYVRGEVESLACQAAGAVAPSLSRRQRAWFLFLLESLPTKGGEYTQYPGAIVDHLRAAIESAPVAE